MSGGTALLHAAVFGMTEVVDVTSWLTLETPPRARTRALVMAANHQWLPVIEVLSH